MSRIFILRRHEVQAYDGWTGKKIPRNDFTIIDTFADRALCKAAADAKRSKNYVFTVGVVTLKGGAA